MSRTEIKVTGFGGQGVILLGYIIGKAAAIYDRQHAVQTQSYGPEARGGACSAGVVLGDEMVDYPHVTHPDIMISMSQEAYDTYLPTVRENGIVLVDEGLVHVDGGELKNGIRAYKIPATKFAEDLGRKIVANIVMLGFFTAVAGKISLESVKAALESSIPKGTEAFNRKAFERGYSYGKEI